MAASSWRRLLASRLVVLFRGFRPLSYTVNLVPMRLDLQRKHKNRLKWSDVVCVCVSIGMVEKNKNIPSVSLMTNPSRYYYMMVKYTTMS